MLRERLRRTFRINAAAEKEESVMVIGSHESRNGSLSSTGTIQIDGRVEGDVRCKRLVVTARALIDGTITARTAHIDGAVNGPIDAGRVFLGPTAVVKGNITYEALNISTGASISGFCRDRRHIHGAGSAAAATEDSTPLPFNLAKAACRKSPGILAPVAPLALARNRKPGSMRAAWESLQNVASKSR